MIKYLVTKEKKNMYCSNCGHEVKDGSMFCPYCGVSLDKNRISQKEKDTKFNYKLEKKRQPTKALVVEGIGFVFFIYLLLLNSTGWKIMVCGCF